MSNRYVGPLSLALDSAGHLHVAVAGKGIVHVTNSSGTWTSDRIDTQKGYIGDSSLAVDTDDTLSLAFAQTEPLPPGVPDGAFITPEHVFVTANNTGTWSEPSALAGSTENPTLLVRDGIEYLAYDEAPTNDKQGCAPSLATYYASGPPGALRTETIAPDGRASLMALAPDGTPRVVSSAWCSGPPYWWYADRSSGTFVTEPIPVITALDTGVTALALDSGGAPRLILARTRRPGELGSDIYYTALMETGWMQPIKLVDDAWRAAIAIDSHDNVHVAAVGRAGVSYVTDRSGAFLSSVIFSNTFDEEESDASVAIRVDGGGDVHVLYSASEASLATPGLWHIVGSTY